MGASNLRGFATLAALSRLGILANPNCVGSLSEDLARSLQPPTAQRFGLGLLKTQFNTAAPDGVFDPLDREGLFSQLS